MNSFPTVTFIVAIKNAELLLPNLIRSFEEQVENNFEVIFVDGFSTDASRMLAGKCKLPFSIVIDGGANSIAEAWNCALDLAKGEWIVFLGADDCLFDNTVMLKMNDIVTNLSSFDIVVGKAHINGQNAPFKISGDNLNRKIKRRMPFAHGATFHNRRLFANGNRFSHKYKISLDYEFLLRFKDLQIKTIDVDICVIGDGGVSKVKWKDSLLEARKAQIDNKAMPLLSIYFWYMAYRFTSPRFRSVINDIGEL